jgi:hypothetical protein
VNSLVKDFPVGGKLIQCISLGFYGVNDIIVAINDNIMIMNNWYLLIVIVCYIISVLNNNVFKVQSKC